MRPHPSTCPGLWHRSSGPLDLILPHRCQGPGHAQRPCVQHPAPGTMGARPPAPPRDAPRLPLRGSSCPLPRRSPAALIWEFWLVSVPASASRMICWDGASWAGSCPARAGRGAGGVSSTHSPGDPGRVTPGHHRPPAWVPSQAVGTGMHTGTPVFVCHRRTAGGYRQQSCSRLQLGKGPLHPRGRSPSVTPPRASPGTRPLLTLEPSDDRPPFPARQHPRPALRIWAAEPGRYPHPGSAYAPPEPGGSQDPSGAGGCRGGWVRCTRAALALFPRAELPSQQVRAFRNRGWGDVNQRLVGPKAPVSFPRKEVMTGPETPWVLGRGPAQPLPGAGAALGTVPATPPALRLCLVVTGLDRAPSAPSWCWLTRERFQGVPAAPAPGLAPPVLAGSG